MTCKNQLISCFWNGPGEGDCIVSFKAQIKSLSFEARNGSFCNVFVPTTSTTTLSSWCAIAIIRLYSPTNGLPLWFCTLESRPNGSFNVKYPFLCQNLHWTAKIVRNNGSANNGLGHNTWLMQPTPTFLQAWIEIRFPNLSHAKNLILQMELEANKNFQKNNNDSSSSQEMSTPL